MTPLLRAELLKLSTTRTFAALAGVAVGISLLITILVGLLTEPTQESVLADVFTSDVSSLFILVLAVVGITGEWRHRTITSSVLAAPDRLRFLAAKTIAFAAAGLALSLLISLAVALVGFTILSVRDGPTPDAGELAGQIGRIALVAALLGGLGVVVGALVRNQVVAVVGMLLLTFVVEPAVIALVPEVGRYGPLVALPTAAAGLPEGDVGLGGVDLLPAGLAAAVMLAWIGVCFSGGVALLRRRDIG